MKIVVIGGTGLIGSKLVTILRGDNHEVIVASPSTGVNTVTGDGLHEALEGAVVVIDVTNAPSPEDKAAMSFFDTAGKNLLAAGRAAGIKHHIVLSVVGTDRLQANGYFRAKQVQEDLVKASGISYTIVQATQFFEFVSIIADATTINNEVHLSPALFQPISADEVADVIADIAVAVPLNTTVEVAGPEKVGLDKLVRKYFELTGDQRNVITDPRASFFGVELNDQSLTAGDNARLGSVRFESWLNDLLVKAVPAK